MADSGMRIHSGGITAAYWRCTWPDCQEPDRWEETMGRGPECPVHRVRMEAVPETVRKYSANW